MDVSLIFLAHLLIGCACLILAFLLWRIEHYLEHPTSPPIKEILIKI